MSAIISQPIDNKGVYEMTHPSPTTISTSSDDKNLRSTLSSQLALCVGYNSRGCSSLSDEQFLQAGLDRVISQASCGRDFLQHLEEARGVIIPRSTFFGALKSKRRLEFVQELSTRYYDSLSASMLSAGVDYLSEFSEFAEYDVHSADGHFIEHACHTERNRKGKLFAAGNIYILNMRTGAIRPLACISDGSDKPHEMPIYRKAVEELGFKRKTIHVGDRAYIDFAWWSKQSNKGNYIISRTKSNSAILYCGEYSFDKEDPVNAGVVRDRIGGNTTSGKTFRIIDYVDPETGEEMTFYTTLSAKFRPGAICWLYFQRWRIEKVFDNLKNSLKAKKAWATGKVAAEIQGHMISIMYNFLRFLTETVQKETGCTDEKVEKKYKKNLEQRKTIAERNGRKIHPLLYTSRIISRISEQFIRVVRNFFNSEISIRALLPRFVNRLKFYL